MANRKFPLLYVAYYFETHLENVFYHTIIKEEKKKHISKFSDDKSHLNVSKKSVNI